MPTYPPPVLVTETLYDSNVDLPPRSQLWED